MKCCYNDAQQKWMRFPGLPIHRYIDIEGFEVILRDIRITLLD